MSLLEANPVYKPFRYPWAYDAWLMQQRVHWLPEEVPLADDVKDWHNKMTAEERNLLTQIFRFFTQSDIEVANCYMKQYSRVFEPTEVQMMLSAFSNMETVHIAAYSHLLICTSSMFRRRKTLPRRWPCSGHLPKVCSFSRVLRS